LQQIEIELGKLSRAELKQVRDFLDNMLEDELEFSPEFEAQIQQSEQEMGDGLRPASASPGFKDLRRIIA
jgi:hypothetical protein